MNKSVFCVIFCVCIKVVLSKSVQNTDLDPIEAQCFTKSNENVLVFDENGYLIEGNDQVNELLRCNWLKIGLLCQDGTINMYKLQRTLENNLIGQYDNYVRTYLASKTIKDCDNIQGNSKGDTCVKVYNCIHKKLDVNKKILEEEHE